MTPIKLTGLHGMHVGALVDLDGTVSDSDVRIFGAVINGDDAAGDGNGHIAAGDVERFGASAASIDDHLAALEIERCGAPAATREPNVRALGDFDEGATGQTKNGMRTFGGAKFIGVADDFAGFDERDTDVSDAIKGTLDCHDGGAHGILAGQTAGDAETDADEKRGGRGPDEHGDMPTATVIDGDGRRGGDAVTRFMQSAATIHAGEHVIFEQQGAWRRKGVSDVGGDERAHRYNRAVCQWARLAGGIEDVAVDARGSGFNLFVGGLFVLDFGDSFV